MCSIGLVFVQHLAFDGTQALGAGIGDDQLHQLPAQAVALEIGADQDGVFAGRRVRFVMQARDAEHRARCLIEGDEGHGLGVVDLDETGEKVVAELFHQAEKAQAHIVRGHGREERPVKWLVVRPQRTDVNRLSIRQRDVAFPFANIDGHGRNVTSRDTRDYVRNNKCRACSTVARAYAASCSSDALLIGWPITANL